MKNRKLCLFQIICGVFMLLSLAALMGRQTSFCDYYVFLAAPFSLLLEISKAAFEVSKPMLGIAVGAVECGLWILLISAAGAAEKGKILERNVVYGILWIFIAVDLFFVKVFGAAILIGLMILMRGIWKNRQKKEKT